MTYSEVRFRCIIGILLISIMYINGEKQSEQREKCKLQIVVAVDRSNLASDEIWFNEQIGALEQIDIDFLRVAIVHNEHNSIMECRFSKDSRKNCFHIIRDASTNDNFSLQHVLRLVKSEFDKKESNEYDKILILIKNKSLNIEEINNLLEQFYSMNVAVIVLEKEGYYFKEKEGGFNDKKHSSVAEAADFLKERLEDRCSNVCPPPDIKRIDKNSCHGVRVNKTCRVTCKDNFKYTNVGQEEIKCLENLTWDYGSDSRKDNKCKKVCVDLPIIVNGTIERIDDCNSAFRKSECQIKCDDGFKRTNPVCEKKGRKLEWSKGPYCEKAKCEENPEIPNARFYGDNTCENTEVGHYCNTSYECRNNFELTNLHPRCEFDSQEEKGIWKYNDACIEARCLYSSRFINVEIDLLVNYAINKTYDSIKCKYGYTPKSSRFPKCVYKSHKQKAQWNRGYECELDLCKTTPIVRNALNESLCVDYAINATCDSIRCKHGYTPILPDVPTKCVYDEVTQIAKWNRDYECVIARCRAPPRIPNALNAELCVDYAINATCDSIRCEYGFTPNSPAVTTKCVYDEVTQIALWDIDYECVIVLCVAQPEYSNALFSERCVNYNIGYDCAELQCLPNHKNVTKLPTCVYADQSAQWDTKFVCKKYQCDDKKLEEIENSLEINCSERNNLTVCRITCKPGFAVYYESPEPFHHPQNRTYCNQSDLWNDIPQCRKVFACGQNEEAFGKIQLWLSDKSNIEICFKKSENPKVDYILLAIFCVVAIFSLQIFNGFLLFRKWKQISTRDNTPEEVGDVIIENLITLN